MARVFVVATTVAALLALVARPAGAATLLDIPWASVPSSEIARSIPVGCECVDTNETPCVKFECRCICDLTAGACDAECCCDAECTAAEIQRATARGTCLPSGPANSSVLTCIDLDEHESLAQINPRHRMDIQELDGFGRVLCVAVNNNPIVGVFFSDPGTLDETVFLRDDLQAEPTFARTFALSATRTATAYKPGDRVPVALAAGAALVETGDGYLHVPSTVARHASGSFSVGDCDFAGVVRFATDVPALGGVSAIAASGVSAATADTVTSSDSCFVQPGSTTASVAAVCGALDFDRAVTNLRFGATPSATVQDLAAWITPTVANVDRVNADGSITAGVDATTVTTTFQTGGGAGAFCEDALVGVEYDVATTAAGAIAAVSVRATVANLTQTGSGTGRSAEGSAARVRVRVRFAPDAATQGAITRDLDRNNVVDRARSGMPGYRMDLPVLAGVDVSQDGKSAVAAFQEGLVLNGPGLDGTCPLAAGDIVREVAVPFGSDLSVGCVVHVDAATLAAQFCSGAAAVPTFLQVNATRLGMFGNADPLDVGQWITIVPPTTPSAPSLDTTSHEAKCANIITGANLNILAARVGEKGNPQFKIVAAKLEHLVSEWGIARSLAASASGLELRFSVSFSILSDGALNVFVPPPPPVVKLPHDLFYPFQVNSGSESRTSEAASSFESALFLRVVVAVFAAVALLQPVW